MPSIKAVKKLTKSKKNSESQREKEALEAQARARELAEQMVADETELNWYQEELAMYDQRQVGGKSNKNDQGGVGVGTGEYDDYGGLGGGAGGAAAGGGMTTGGGGPMSTQTSTMDYFLSHDDAALDDEVKITPEERDNLVDVELFHDPDMTAAGSAAAAAIVSGEANTKNKEKSSGGGKARKKMSLLRRSKSAKNKSKSSTAAAAAASTSGAATAAAAEDYTKDQDQYSYNSDHQPPSRDESIDDLLGFGEDQVQRDAFEMLQHQLPPPPSAPISAVEEFTARRSARVASNYTTADGDTWVENLAVVELPNVKEAGGKGKSGSRSLLRRSRNTSNAAESEEAAAAAAAAAAEDEESPIGRLAIRPYFQSIKTGMRVWDEPPTGASNVQYASAEVRKMAELQMADMRHNAEAVVEARSVAKLMKEEREAKEGSSGGRSSVIKKSLKKKLGKKKKKGDSTKRPYKTAEDLGITQSPQRSSRPPSERKAAPTNEFELYDEDMQIAIAMSIGNDGVISRYDEVSERNNSTAATGGGAGVGGNDDEALAMAISLSEQEDRQKQQQSTQEDLLMKLALEESSKMGERNVSSSSSAAASLPQDETTATSTEKKSKKDKRKNRFRSSSRRSSAQKSGDAGMYDHSYDGGGGKMPARVGIGGELEDNPYEGGEQYASDFSSSSMEGGGGTTPRQAPPMYPPGTSIDDLLGNGGGGPDTPRHRTYSHQSYQSHTSHASHQSEGYLGVGYEQGAEERLNTMASNPATSSNMSITSASSMSTRSEHRGGGSSGNRRSKYQNRHRTYSHETSGSIPSIQSVDHASVDLLDVAGVPGTESDHSHSDSLAGVGGPGGGGGGIPGVPGAASGEAGGEYYTDGEASAASVSSALRKKLGDAVVSSGKKIATARKKKGEQPSLEDSADAAGLV